MKQKNSKIRPFLKFDTMDVCDMKEYENEFFDIVIDKSTSDAVFCLDNAYYKVA